MLVSVFGEIVSSIIGDAFLGWLFPNWQRPTPPPPEGVWNASLGSIAAFLSGLAAMFVVTPSFVIAQGRTDEEIPLLIMLVVALGLAITGGVLARRTFLVTPRRHTLASIALWCSRVSVILGVFATGVLLTRVMSATR